MIQRRPSGRTFLRSVIPWTSVAILVLIIGASHRALTAARSSWSTTEERILLPPPRVLRLALRGIGVGNELAADLAWARTLVYYGDGLVKHTRLLDVEPLLLVVNTLDPKFRRPYIWGNYATTFRAGTATQEEFRSSVEILKRGAAALPDDWEIFWMLGVRHAYDLRSNDPKEQQQFKEQAADYMEHAMRLKGAPSDLPLKAAQLRTKLGQKDRALRELREMILTTEDQEGRAKLIERYRMLASEEAGDALASASKAFNAEWQKHLPCAPPTLYNLIGPKPRAVLDLGQLARVDAFELESESAGDSPSEPQSEK
ncbi:MAG: hypothetical protein HY698_08470 [Deltaproteobacteria bacterium]|nr:hypothetical protein [Deltaproteobacteria bacterium]